MILYFRNPVFCGISKFFSFVNCCRFHLWSWKSQSSSPMKIWFHSFESLSEAKSILILNLLGVTWQSILLLNPVLRILGASYNMGCLGALMKQVIITAIERIDTETHISERYNLASLWSTELILTGELQWFGPSTAMQTWWELSSVISAQKPDEF